MPRGAFSAAGAPVAGPVAAARGAPRVLLAGLVLWAATWHAAVLAQAVTPPAGEARQWLQRMQAAAARGNYQGTLVYQVAGTLSSARVSHYSVGEHTYELLEALDGRPQRVLRHNDSVHTFLPGKGILRVERRELMVAWTTTPQAVDPRALEAYEFRREGEERIADRSTAVIVLEPRDELRYAQRLWADQASGLTLRADIMGLADPAAARSGKAAAREVLESTRFSEVAIDVRPQHETVLSAIRELSRQDGLRTVRPQARRTTLEAEGWTLARPVPGFRLVGCLKRGPESGAAAEEQSVLQAVFSDGLVHVSVFVEAPRAAGTSQESEVRRGAMAALTTRRGDHWITAFGDVPLATLRLMVDALARRNP